MKHYIKGELVDRFKVHIHSTKMDVMDSSYDVSIILLKARFFVVFIQLIQKFSMRSIKVHSYSMCNGNSGYYNVSAAAVSM